MNKRAAIVIAVICLAGCTHFQPSSLIKSSSKGNLAEINAYIQAGANINEQDKQGYNRTPLMHAISQL
jgi:hypothetical protein